MVVQVDLEADQALQVLLEAMVLISVELCRKVITRHLLAEALQEQQVVLVQQVQQALQAQQGLIFQVMLMLLGSQQEHV
jgi:hypothetical protein